jgi:hypothetical protein
MTMADRYDVIIIGTEAGGGTGCITSSRSC